MAAQISSQQASTADAHAPSIHLSSSKDTTPPQHSGEDNHHHTDDNDDDDASPSSPNHDPTSLPPAHSAQSFTPRSLLMGLVIGTLITFSNTYFGLQTGWISSMAMPSSLIGFAVFKSISKHLSFPFSPVENVLIQTVAGAVGTMPLGCGFVGVIPALEFLLRERDDGGGSGPLRLGLWKLIIWSLGVCMFGVVFAVPLRKEVIIREKLRFPSGAATAVMIRVLHGGGGGSDEKKKGGEDGGDERSGETERLLAPEPVAASVVLSPDDADGKRDKRKDWKAKIRLLVMAFAVSALFTLVSYFIPQLRDLPIFGLPLATGWLWTLNPSPAYVGQGIIMGPSTSLHMLLGAVIGWGFLSPLAKNRGWAPGPVGDWEEGSKGWIVWVSLAIMLADSIINLGWLVAKPLINHGPRYTRKFLNALRSRTHGYSTIPPESSSSSSSQVILKPTPTSSSPEDDDAPPSQLISPRTIALLLPLTLALNVLCMHISFGNLITPTLSLLATLLALLLSIMGVRALGETDLNPVSGISKLTQLLFALAAPRSGSMRRTAIVTNLLAGAVSESGALQAGDMLQDLKTGHLLGASPKAQFYGQFIGSLFGAVISAGVYRMYVSVYDVPGDMFQVPTAYVWIFTARLVTGEGLPRMAWQVAVIFGVVFAVTTVLRIGLASVAGGESFLARLARWRDWIPGGIAVAVGMYNVPSFTLARAIGGVIAWWWGRKKRLEMQSGGKYARVPTSDEDEGQDEHEDEDEDADAAALRKAQADEDEDESSSTVIVLASGLILGEGVVSIVNLVLASFGVPHL
ncbi:hypothetical protein FQN54_000062 [Arachnomyces sp. PD_36]|nr:hypothetical protein FQN54_000062 [Arachnomyces sp. PD_36]